jgi:hypothetical protein
VILISGALLILLGFLASRGSGSDIIVAVDDYIGKKFQKVDGGPAQEPNSYAP